MESGVVNLGVVGVVDLSVEALSDIASDYLCILNQQFQLGDWKRNSVHLAAEPELLATDTVHVNGVKPGDTHVVEERADERIFLNHIAQQGRGGAHDERLFVQGHLDGGERGSECLRERQKAVI